MIKLEDKLEEYEEVYYDKSDFDERTLKEILDKKYSDFEDFHNKYHKGFLFEDVYDHYVDFLDGPYDSEGLCDLISDIIEDRYFTLKEHEMEERFYL